MTANLDELFEAAARDEVEAVEREFRLTDDGVRGYVRAVSLRRRVFGVALAFGCGAASGGLAFGVVHLWPAAELGVVATPSATVTESGTVVASPTGPEASPTPSSSPSPTFTVLPPAETSSPAASVETSVVELPAQVSGVGAGPGGGSGEVEVHWDAVEGATGYRVYRSSSPDGDFVRSAAFDVATGATRVYLGGSYESIQVWQASATTFQYIEAVDGSRGYFRVAAFNDAGTGPKSAVVCGAPVGAEDGC